MTAHEPIARQQPDARRPESAWLRFVDWFIPASVHAHSTGALQHARVTVVACFVGSLASLSLPLLQSQLDPMLRLAAQLAGFAFTATPFLLRFTGALGLVGNLYAATLFSFLVFSSAVTGGRAQAQLLSLGFVPLLAVLVAGRSAGIAWGLLTLTALAGLSLLAQSGYEFPIQPDAAIVEGARFRAATVLVLTTLLIALVYEFLKERALHELGEARRLSEEARLRLEESEARFRALTENASDIITEWDENGRILYMSPQVEALSGEPAEGFLDHGWERYAEAMRPQDVESFRALLRRRFELHESNDLNFRFRHRDGGWRWVEMTVRPFQRAGGENHFVSVARDLTDRREIETLRRVTRELEQALAEQQRSEEALRESEERLRVVVETATDAILSIDDAGHIVFANPATQTIFGYAASELLGRDLTELMPKELRKVYQKELRRYLETGERSTSWQGVELAGLHQSGREIPIEVSFGVQQRGARSIFTGVVRDITERKQAQDALRASRHELMRRNVELARTNQELEEFTTLASHDLQEPLRKLVSFSELLREDAGDALPEAAQRDLHFIGDGARRMHALVRDLLALSRASAVELRLEPVAVDECVDRALENLALRVAETSAVIARDPLPRLSADARLLEGVYQNLIHNALKFTRGDPPRLRLTAEGGPAGWILGVRDEGIGLRADQAEEIFKPFRRLHSAQQYEGSGIGLAFCRRAVERLGGRIWVDSEPERGAHFRFTLSG